MKKHPKVSEYISAAPSEQEEIMETIRELVHQAVANVQEDFKWSRPVFRTEKDFAYLKTAKAHVTLGFFNFEKLNDPDGLLEGSGKDMRHIRISSKNAVDAALLSGWLQAASQP
jgi:hypothetical protein